MRSLLYVCLDGLGDDPIPELGGRTPLEAADTPFLDSLAERGRTGNVITVAPGVAPESDIGVFGILGYDPREEHPGRGVLEAVGIGMDFDEDDLAYRINFATAEWPEIVDRRVGPRPLLRGVPGPRRGGPAGAHAAERHVPAPGHRRAPRRARDPIRPRAPCPRT